MDSTDRPPIRIGPYTVVRRLGGGGMGEVYLAHSTDGLNVAVKVMRRELSDDPRFRTRFRREVQAARAVAGRGTAAVIDADVEAPQPWLASEYVPGPSLHDHVDRHGPLTDAQLTELGAGLADALCAIHEAGLLHRDLKPSNILLTAEGPRVIDFGIAQAVDATVLTATGVVIGSPGFMSPEQVQGGPVGRPSDVFSLGACLVFAGTGGGPFGTGPAPALLYRVVHDEPAIPKTAPWLREIVASCLAKDPDARPTAPELRARLATPPTPASHIPYETGRPGTVPLTSAYGPHAEEPPPSPPAGSRVRLGLLALAASVIALAVAVAVILWPDGRAPGSSGPTASGSHRAGTAGTTASSGTASPPLVTANRVTVQARAHQTSWVDVSDASGAHLFNGILRAGESKTWTSERQIRLVIGNGAAVALTVNGKALGPAGSAGQVVRLTYGPGDPVGSP